MAKQHWLFKTEPSTWSWDDQTAAEDQTTSWDGVRNHVAKNNMKAMALGDLGFFYHSVKEKRIVGIVEVVGEYVPDPTDTKREGDQRFGMVHVRAIEPVDPPITLEQIKAEPALGEMVLVNNSRLSVQPVTPAQWEAVLKLSR